MTGKVVDLSRMSPESRRNLAFAEYRLAQTEEQISVMQRSGEAPIDKIEAEAKSLRDEIRKLKQEGGANDECLT